MLLDTTEGYDGDINIERLGQLSSTDKKYDSIPKQISLTAAATTDPLLNQQPLQLQYHWPDPDRRMGKYGITIRTKHGFALIQYEVSSKR